MLTFDVPRPFSTVGQRTVTNVPAQSLAMMNDPFLYEQSHVLARQLLQHANLKSFEERVQHVYLAAFGRTAFAAELQVSKDALEQFGRTSGKGPQSVDAWADLCHAFFSLNEFRYLR